MALRQTVPEGRLPVALEVFETPSLPTPTFYRRLGKRAFDIVGSLILLIASTPLILLLAALVLVTSGAPAFYGATRVGKDGRPFRMWKLRTMVKDADAIIEYWKRRATQEGIAYMQSYKLHNDPRITPIGRILRKTSLDELPQLFNVLRGDMSLVGPRPIIESELSKYSDDGHTLLSVRPGVTGLWQVRGRNEIDYPERAQIELHYVASVSFWRDAMILLLTGPALIRVTGR